MKKLLALFLTMIFFTSNVSFAIINDDFANETLDKNLNIPEYKKQNINDNLITQKFINEHKNESYKKEFVIIDDFANKNLSQYKNIKLVHYVPVNFQNLQKISLTIKPTKNLTTKDKTIKEGANLKFILTKDFSYNNKTYKKGTEINARIENIFQNQPFGMPANLEIGNFQINNTNLDGELKLKGANRAIWVIPIGYVGMCFFGAGILIFPIRGGHAKLTKEKSYNLMIHSFQDETL